MIALRRAVLLLSVGGLLGFLVLVALSARAEREIMARCPFEGKVLARWPDSATVLLKTGRVATVRRRADSTWAMDKAALKGICRLPADTIPVS